ncbi:ATP-binding protein [Methanofollis sp. W23]|uniref:DEAD/DEAH box helicase n=1 Tax=Methanofollis sp. W23 TaxID=2817849 RepID=UPI001AE9074A|nr:ATP-binding protein [Methanofollis sp. W23]
MLGCLCWVNNKKVNNSWVLYLNPLICLDVSVEEGPEGSLYITPDAQKWEFSPRLEPVLRNKLSYRPEKGLHEYLPDFIEKAEETYARNGKSLCTSLYAEIITEIPVLKEILDTSKTQWILFAPPDSYSYSKHLLDDYNEIERRLRDDPNDIGGLRLLGGSASGIPEEKETVLPVVPLNNEQQMAVSTILSGNPVSVISGPPGCGKSQVVVSLLVNSWARGTSVLFASNNNKAVEVIHDRINRIESSRPLLPVTLKAGNKSTNTICNGLRRIKDAIKVYNPYNQENLRSLIEKQKSLEREKDRYKDYIRTGVPQQIEESLFSAFDAYAKVAEMRHELDGASASYRSSLNEIGYQIPPEEFEEAVAGLERWLGEIPSYQQEIKNNTKKREHYQREIEEIDLDLKEVLKKLGLEPDMKNWPTLNTHRDEPEDLLKWYGNYKSYLSRPLEKTIASHQMKEEYRVWSGKEEAEKWAGSATSLMDEINLSCHRETETIETLQEIQDKYRRAKESVNNLGISEDAQIDPDPLEKWMAGYKEYAMLPRGFFPNPFSRRSRLNRRLRDLETQIFQQYPVSVQREIGTPDDQSRATLSEIIEDTLKWLAARKQYEDSAAESARVRSLFSRLCLDLKGLKFFDSPESSTDIPAWRKIADEIAGKIDLTERAAAAWEAYGKAEKEIGTLKAVASDFETIAPGNPIKKAWVSGTGKAFTDSVRALTSHPDNATLAAAREALYTNDIESFVDTWRTLFSRLDTYQALQQTRDAVPAEADTLGRWWGKEPYNPVEYPDHTVFPEDDSYLLHLDQCHRWLEEWKHYSETVLPPQKARLNEELEWARDEIKSACQKVPDEKAQKELLAEILPVITANDTNWPIQEWRTLFEPFRSSEINIRITRIDQKQEVLSFEIASEKRIAEIRSISSGKKDLDQLLRSYENHKFESFSLPAYQADLFMDCLPVAPIWITTSLSTQSIPLQPGIFDIVVVDEASQCDISSVLPLIYRAKHLAVIGDPKQLPAIPRISSPEMDQRIATHHGVENMPDMFRHISNDLYRLAEESLPDGCQVIDLLEHYRSHPLIVGFINLVIYNKKLAIMRAIECSKEDLGDNGIFGIDIRGYCVKSGSWKNDKEAKRVAELVDTLVHSQKSDPRSIGIVTPFRAQKELIQTELARLKIEDVTVGTAHTFQGDERRVIVFSPVISRNMAPGAVNFVQNPVNLINVALSRAKDALYVVTDYEFCKKSGGIMADLVRYIETVDMLRKSANAQGYEKLYLFSLMLVEGWKPEVDLHIGGVGVDFALNEGGVALAVNIVYKSEISMEEKALRHEKLKKHGYDVMEIRARKISDTPREVISDIKTKIEL